MIEETQEHESHGRVCKQYVGDNYSKLHLSINYAAHFQPRIKKNMIFTKEKKLNPCFRKPPFLLYGHA
jgi:hypothetical protein